MALQSGLLRLLAICTLIIAIVTIILAEEKIVEEINEVEEELEPELQLAKRDIVKEWVDYMEKRRRTGNSSRRKMQCLSQGDSCSVSGPLRKIVPCCAPMACYDRQWESCGAKESCLCMPKRYRVDSYF